MTQAGKPKTVNWHRTLVKSGLQARLTGSQRSVLSVLIAYANRDAVAWPGVGTIAGKAGTTRRTAQLALRQLVAAGAIDQLTEGGGRGNSARYRLRPDRWPTAEPPAKGRNPLHPFHEEKRSVGRSESAQLGAEKGRAPVRPKVQREDSTGSVGTAPPTSQPAIPAPDDPSLFDAAAAAELLAQRGFEQRDARDQVRRYGVAAVRRAVEHADFLQVKGEIRKSYRGVVVKALRERWPVDPRLVAERQQAEAKRRAAAAEQRRQSEAEQRRAQLADAEQRDELLWSQLSDTQRAELHREIVAYLPAAMRDLPAGSRSIRPLIIRMARGELPDQIIAARNQKQGIA